MSSGSEVIIAGRAFTLGAIYAPRRGVSGPHQPRRLLEYSTESPLPGGRVTVAVVPSGRERIMAGAEWAAWAGEELAV